MKKILNTGLIGFGNSGQTFFAPFIAANPGFNLAMISTSDPGRAQLAASIYPDAAVVSTADEIIADEGIDLVLVGSPNTSHFEWTKKALLAGKHVLVEKPFTVTSHDALELIKIAEKENKILSVFQNRRYDADLLTIKEILQKKLLMTLVVRK